MALSAQAPKPPGGYANKVPNASPSPRLIATGGNAALQAADGVDSTPVVTEIYYAEIFVPFPTTIQGMATFAGSVWSDNFKTALFDAYGNIVCVCGDTAGSTTADTYQRLPITSEFQTNPLVGTAGTQVYLAPGTYFAALMVNGTTSRYNSIGKGNFSAGKITGAVYATAFATTSLSLTIATTFTATAPIISLY